MSKKQKVKYSYETLWKFIIRPPRDEYTEEYLGLPDFMYRGKVYQRKDYDLISSEGHIMKCSFIEPQEEYRPKKIMPVILYLHGNSSSRIEGMNLLKEILKRDINLFVIDFPGCGLSGGEYISLGYHESDDVKVIIDFIENLPGTGRIGLWGRSMGAATTMIYSHRDKRVKAICMDSPFADFKRLAKELIVKQIKLPNFLMDGVLKIIRSTVLGKNGLDINKLRPIDSADKTFQPAIFIHANKDELINNQHSVDLLNKYAGKDKVLKKCDGGHNSRRPNKLLKEVGEFFYKHLVNDDTDNLNNDNVLNEYHVHVIEDEENGNVDNNVTKGSSNDDYFEQKEKKANDELKQMGDFLNNINSDDLAENINDMDIKNGEDKKE